MKLRNVLRLLEQRDKPPLRPRHTDQSPEVRQLGTGFVVAGAGDVHAQDVQS